MCGCLLGVHAGETSLGHGVHILSVLAEQPVCQLANIVRQTLAETEEWHDLLCTCKRSLAGGL